MVSEATEEPYDDVLNKVYTVDTETLGLTVDENGTILLAGKPYYAFGVNSFTLVTRYLEGAGETMYRDQFALLKKYNIPFVRVNFGGYWPAYYEQFDKDPEAVLRLMQDVVKCAEEYNIGLICSLLWYDSSISAHVGEHRSDMGDLNSKTVKYATEYVSRIVAEFKGSPAIWAWEIGNEYNLDADLCDPEYRSRLPVGPCTPQFPSGFDFYTSEELVAFYTAIGNAIRAQDPTRMISTGNGDLRTHPKRCMRRAAKRPENALMDRKLETGYHGRILRNVRIFYAGSPRHDLLSSPTRAAGRERQGLFSGHPRPVRKQNIHVKIL